MDPRPLVPFLILALALAFGAPVQADRRQDGPVDAPSAEPDAVYHEPVDVRALHGSTASALTIPAAAFVSRGDSESIFSSGDGYVQSWSGFSIFVQAPVSLPDGVEIEGMYLYAFDNSSSVVRAYLMRQSFGNSGAAQYMAATSTVAELPFVQVASDDTVENGIVDNDTYQYYIFAEIGGSGQRLYTVRIVYNDAVATAAAVTTSTQVPRARGFPNPFGEQTSLRFSLPSPQPVNVRVYDAAGRVVRTLLSGQLGSGRHDMSWDGRDGSGRPVSNGIYYLRVTDDQFELATKLVRLR